MKNIILCFRHEAFFNGSLGTTFCGLGDIIKGFVHTYSYCKSKGYNFYLNLDGHCLKSFLNFKKFKYNSKIADNIPFIDGLKIENYISTNENENIFLMTDGGNHGRLFYSSELVNDFENVFFSRKLIKNKINKNYPDCSNIFHARFGDGEMVCKDFLDDYYLRNNSHQYSPFDWYNSIDIKDTYRFIYKNFREEISASDFVCSDHLSFKHFLSELIDIKYIDAESVHLGLTNSKKKDIENTLIDFYIIYNSESGISVSQYPFGKRPSGFAYWIDKLFFKDYRHYSFSLLENRISPLNS